MKNKKKSGNLSVPVQEVPTSMTDAEFYRGDFLPELTSVPPKSIDSDMSQLVRELWDGGRWRKSERDSMYYKRAK